MFRTFALAAALGLASFSGAMAAQQPRHVFVDHYSTQEGNGPGTGIFGPNNHVLTPVPSPHQESDGGDRQGANFVDISNDH